MKRRIGYVVVATVAAFIGCATKRSGLDSESHFACDSNADCAEHAPNLACVERRCVPVPQMTSSASNSEQGPVETMESWVTRTWYNDATVTGVDPGPVHGACVPTDVWPDGAAVS